MRADDFTTTSTERQGIAADLVHHNAAEKTRETFANHADRNTDLVRGKLIDPTPSSDKAKGVMNSLNRKSTLKELRMAEHDLDTAQIELGKAQKQLNSITDRFSKERVASKSSTGSSSKADPLKGTSDGTNIKQMTSKEWGQAQARVKAAQRNVDAAKAKLKSIRKMPIQKLKRGAVTSAKGAVYKEVHSTLENSELKGFDKPYTTYKEVQGARKALEKIDAKGASKLTHAKVKGKVDVSAGADLTKSVGSVGEKTAKSVSKTASAQARTSIKKICTPVAPTPSTIIKNIAKATSAAVGNIIGTTGTIGTSIMSFFSAPTLGVLGIVFSLIVISSVFGNNEMECHVLGDGDVIEIPSQYGGAFSFECLGEDGWHKPNGVEGIPSDTLQYQVYQKWLQQGHKYKDGVAIVDNRYLVAVAPKFGKPGDEIDIYMTGNTVIQAIIGDEKNVAVTGANEWGHDMGQTVVEFIVEPSRLGSNGIGAINGWILWDAPEINNGVSHVTKIVNLFNKGESENESGDSGTLTDEQQAVIDTANVTTADVVLENGEHKSGSGYCAAWVTKVFDNAGIGHWAGDAKDQYSLYCTSDNRDDLKPGMIVAVDSSSSGTTAGLISGHVGIYMGDNKIRHNADSVRTDDLDDWIATFGQLSTTKWGWLGGKVLGTGGDVTSGCSTGTGAKAVIDAAKSQLGMPYSTDASAAWNYPEGHDQSYNCSGLVWWAFNQAGYDIPHAQAVYAPGYSSYNGEDSMAWVIHEVNKTWKNSINELKPGDLAFLGTSWDCTGHVAIYIGDGQVIESNYGGVQIADWSEYPNVIGGGSIIMGL